MLLLLTKSFFDKLKVDGIIMLTIHDEIRCCVKEDSKLRAVYAIQLAHLYVRAAFLDTYGMEAIPTGVAYFSLVDVDKVLRKEPLDACVTPSQPDGLPLGEVMTIGDIQKLFS
jgi:DNA polymerase gamma 1